MKERSQGSVEAEMLAYIGRRLEEGALSVSEAEVMAAIIPADRPQLRFRPALLLWS